MNFDRDWISRFLIGLLSTFLSAWSQVMEPKYRPRTQQPLIIFFVGIYNLVSYLLSSSDQSSITEKLLQLTLWYLLLRLSGWCLLITPFCVSQYLLVCYPVKKDNQTRQCGREIFHLNRWRWNKYCPKVLNKYRLCIFCVFIDNIDFIMINAN